MTAVTYNLTKSFRMKLSATGAILQKTLKELFGQPNVYLGTMNPNLGILY